MTTTHIHMARTKEGRREQEQRQADREREYKDLNHGCDPRKKENKAEQKHQTLYNHKLST